MPVAQGGPPPARQALFIGMGALLGVLAVVFLVTRLDQLGGGGDAEQVPLGDPIFSIGQAADVAEAVAERPLLLPDAAGGRRDVWINHLGDDPESGWVAFAVRQPGVEQECFANWVPEDRNFVDTCDDTVYPENGEGLAQYAVSVDPEGALTINLNALDAPSG